MGQERLELYWLSKLSFNIGPDTATNPRNVIECDEGLVSAKSVVGAMRRGAPMLLQLSSTMSIGEVLDHIGAQALDESLEESGD